ncbi:MAG: DUF3416 domain-containing protein, partial [Planctomycetes bacterium]|nr:DUF3416 domain-containing protein [Planctomycetota bacterium]
MPEDRRRKDSLPDRIAARVLIEGVQPEIDAGRFPVKRTVGEEVVVTADIHADGHDVLVGVLRYRKSDDPDWRQVPLEELGNDRWLGRFIVAELGRYEYGLEAWIDRFASWRRELSKKVEAGQDVSSELLEGADLVSKTARRVSPPSPVNRGSTSESARHALNGGNVVQAAADAEWLGSRAEVLAKRGDSPSRVRAALDPELATVMARYADRSQGTSYEPVLSVVVDRERARFGAWYEMFPRSAGSDPTRSATLREAEARLPQIAAMGLDVLYLPPIHPIGRSFRKGPNNSLVAGPNDPGSPWGIGSEAGGHKALHPELGTLDDFDHFVAAAKRVGLEIALDIAFQCSPDHPYVRQHPEWFRHRPDGTIKHAENPPKKYQDIYPLDLECDAWQSLWQELKSVLLFWIGHGVRIFRVDNPHTKPYRFWEWLIREVQAEHSDTVFLSEAFTRSKVMRHLAKLGFNQSYTYFTWRNTKSEL